MYGVISIYFLFTCIEYNNALLKKKLYIIQWTIVVQSLLHSNAKYFHNLFFYYVPEFVLSKGLDILYKDNNVKQIFIEALKLTRKFNIKKLYRHNFCFK